MNYRKIVLTKRQQQLLVHIANGGTDKTFAAVYGISPLTSHKHRVLLMAQLDAHCIQDLTKYAMVHKYIDVPLPV